MKLFHAFPRSRPNAENSVGIADTTDRNRLGLRILESILSDGLLCTPEKFKLYPNPNTENEEKKEFIRKGEPHFKIVQSRACFTLSETIELRKGYNMLLGENSRYVTHTDLFGEFAIGLDPIEARELGIVPTFYYYNNQTMDPVGKIPGLGEQIIERLDETRTLFSILSYIETMANPERTDLFQSQEKLREMGIVVAFEQNIQNKLARLPEELAKLFFELLDTDRVPGWNLVDFINMMLSLYQKTDSTVEDAPLAFFQQREWRLVHHMCEGLNWFGLGNHHAYRNPNALAFAKNIKRIQDLAKDLSSSKDKDYFSWFFDHCWVMAGTYKKHFRDYIREIVVPADCYDSAKSIVESVDFANPPLITVLPCRWRINIENGTPNIKTYCTSLLYHNS